MIYTQMRSVPRWRSPLTPILFLLFALTGGALLSGAPPRPLAPRRPRPRAARRLVSTATAASAASAPRWPPPPASAPSAASASSSRRTPARTTSSARWSLVVGRRHARQAPRVGLLLAVLLPLALTLLYHRPLPWPWPPSPTSRAPSSCAGSSLRRRNTWLDFTTEGAKLPAPPATGGSSLAKPSKSKPQHRGGPGATGPAAAPAGRGALLAPVGQGGAGPADHQPRHRPLGDPQGLAHAPPLRGRGGGARGLRGGRAARRSSPSAASASTPTARRSPPTWRSPAWCASSRSRRARRCPPVSRDRPAPQPMVLPGPRPPASVAEHDLATMIRGFDPRGRRRVPAGPRRAQISGHPSRRLGDSDDRSPCTLTVGEDTASPRPPPPRSPLRPAPSAPARSSRGPLGRARRACRSR